MAQNAHRDMLLSRSPGMGERQAFHSVGNGWRWATAFFLVSVILVGCSSSQGPAVGTLQPASFDSIYVVVENQNFYDAAVFLQFQGGNRRRLATVEAYTTDQFSVRYGQAEFWFHVDFVGARLETRSRRIALNPGETVQLELTANAHRTGQLIIRRSR